MWLAAIRIGCEKSLELQRELQLRPMAAAPDRGADFGIEKWRFLLSDMGIYR